MQRIIHLLKSDLSEKDKEKYISRTANNISCAANNKEFYELDINIILDIMKETNNMPCETAQLLIENTEKKYGIDSVRLLPFIRCDPSVSLDVLCKYECVPLIRNISGTLLSESYDLVLKKRVSELEMIIDELKMQNLKLKDQIEPQNVGYIQFDYKYYYEKERENTYKLQKEMESLKSEIANLKHKMEAKGLSKYDIDFRCLYNNLRRQYAVKKKKTVIWPDFLKQKQQYSMKDSSIDTIKLLEEVEKHIPRIPESARNDEDAVEKALIRNDWKTVEEKFSIDKIPDGFFDGKYAFNIAFFALIKKWAQHQNIPKEAIDNFIFLLGPAEILNQIVLGEFGNTPKRRLEKYLEACILCGDQEGIDFMLQLDPNMNVRDNYKGETNFSEALLAFRADLARQFYTGEPLMNYTVAYLYLYLIAYDSKAADYIQESGVDINCYDPRGNPAFFDFLNESEDLIVPSLEKFIKRGLDIKAVNVHGQNALHYKKCQCRKVRAFLIEQGLT